jgi:type VI secretion system lysozyme-like protein
MKGGRASLFERLTAPVSDTGRQAAAPRDYASLGAAVGAELSRLLNTRCHLRESLNDAADTVLEYGIPDLTEFCPSNEADQVRLAGLLERKIGAYEPRLCNVSVVLSPAPLTAIGLTGRISASLRAGSVYEPVSFSLAIDREGARIEAQDGMTA